MQPSIFNIQKPETTIFDHQYAILYTHTCTIVQTYALMHMKQILPVQWASQLLFLRYVTRDIQYFEDHRKAVR